MAKFPSGRPVLSHYARDNVETHLLDLWRLATESENASLFSIFGLVHHLDATFFTALVPFVEDRVHRKHLTHIAAGFCAALSTIADIKFGEVIADAIGSANFPFPAREDLELFAGMPFLLNFAVLVRAESRLDFVST